MDLLLKSILKKAKLYQSVPETNALYYDLLENFFLNMCFTAIFQQPERSRNCIGRVWTNTILLRPRITYIFNQGILFYLEKQPEQGNGCFDQAISLAGNFLSEGNRTLFFEKRAKNWRGKLSRYELS